MVSFCLALSLFWPVAFIVYTPVAGCYGPFAYIFASLTDKKTEANRGMVVGRGLSGDIQLFSGRKAQSLEPKIKMVEQRSFWRSGRKQKESSYKAS